MSSDRLLPEPVTEHALARAVQVLRAGGVVAFPTETYYGLAVDPFNARALERLFALKARPQAKPVLVLVQDLEQIPLLAERTPELYPPLMAHFWPGPLTLIFPARSTLPWQLTARTEGIGLRRSPHPVAARLLEAFGRPLTATSANRCGEAPASSAQQAAALFIQEQGQDGQGMILDGGMTPGRAGSTVVGMRGNSLWCLRQGVLPFAEVATVATGAAAD